jgi:predicted phage terminase large subunit-like protein
MTEIRPEEGLSEAQLRALDLLGRGAKHIMLAGGTRSGKTWILIWAVIARALKAPGSRHAVLRFRFGHVKQSIVHDTWPAVMERFYPGVPCHIDRSSWFAQFENGSQVWFGGLDDKERTEKILGTEFVTIYLNECSQIPWSSRNIAVTRLAQLVEDVNGDLLPTRMYYDENPPDKGHWSYKVFKLKVDPESRQPLPDPDAYGFMQLNPADNRENLPADFLATLESLPARMRKRFLEGEFRDANPGALFDEAAFERWRVIDEDLPQLLRVVVAVDPSGADDDDNIDNDEIGIVVAALGVDGNAYVLEDLTCKAGPGVWGRVATQAYERHEADRIVAETNYGGAMVRNVIHTARPRTPFREVRASRGKVVRAEPVSALFECGKVRFVGYFRELEDELTAFTTHGYMGERSPNRADACVWAISDLFPELTKPKDEPKPVVQMPMIHRRSETAWMRR